MVFLQVGDKSIELDYDQFEILKSRSLTISGIADNFENIEYIPIMDIPYEDLKLYTNYLTNDIFSSKKDNDIMKNDTKEIIKHTSDLLNDDYTINKIDVETDIENQKDNKYLTRETLLNKYCRRNEYNKFD